MLFYFIRHGQTDANAKHLLAGSGLDVPLNQVGHAQAKRLAQALRATLEHSIHTIIASPMIRTRETAEYLAQELNVKVQFNPQLVEWHLGEWEGCSFDDFGHLLLGDGEPAKGESRRDFYARVEAGWRTVHRDDEPYLIVSHGAVWLAMQDLLKLSRFKINNCDLVKVQWQNSAWSAEVLTLKGCT